MSMRRIIKLLEEEELDPAAVTTLAPTIGEYQVSSRTVQVF